MELQPAEVGLVAMLFKIQHERDRKILQGKLIEMSDNLLVPNGRPISNRK